MEREHAAVEHGRTATHVHAESVHAEAEALHERAAAMHERAARLLDAHDDPDVDEGEAIRIADDVIRGQA